MRLCKDIIIWCGSLVIFLGFLSACSEIKGDKSEESNVRIGVFVDSPVHGLRYTTDTLEGSTNSKGEFKYIEAEHISFYIGEILLGSAVAAPILSPKSLIISAEGIEDPPVTNLTRLLLSLDSNDNPDDGVKIDQQAHIAGKSVSLNFQQSVEDFERDQTVISYLMAANGKSTLVPVDYAQSHLKSSLTTREQ